MKTAFRLVLAAVCAMTPAAPAHAESSARIRDRIASEIDAAELRGHNIDISVREGIVQLTGEVASADDLARVGGIAEQTPGVRGVRNDLRVSGPYALQPAETSREILARIREDPELRNYRISVGMNDGVVLLSGDVASPEQAERMAQIARGMPGVRDVRNSLAVGAAVADDVVTSEVRRALQADPLTSRLEVVSREGVITLSGDLPSRRAVDRALSTALNAAGTRDIKSDITVRGRAY